VKIKRDLFKVHRGQMDEKGQKLEPEQQTVQHIYQGTTPLSVSTPGILREGVQGNIPLEIVAHATAAEVARSVSATCGQCKNFNRSAWIKMLSVADNPGSSAAERHGVNQIRAEILMRMPEPEKHVGADGEYDVNHTLHSMGMCFPLREYYKEKDGKDPGIMAVFSESSCPLEICTPDKPFGLYQPKDLDAEKIGATNYDRVMVTAAGGTPAK